MTNGHIYYLLFPAIRCLKTRYLKDTANEIYIDYYTDANFYGVVSKNNGIKLKEILIDEEEISSGKFKQTFAKKFIAFLLKHSK